jgi:F0F1-type ATP synthase membrane subunit b/b'
LSGANFYQSLAIWSQVFGSLAFVAVLLWLWVRFVQPAVVASQARNNADLAEAEKRRDLAEEEVEVARHELLAADADVVAIRERGAHDAGRLYQRIIDEARNEGQRTVRNAQGELERRRASARERLRADLFEKAIAIAREAAGRLDDATNQRLVGEVVETIERGGGGA